jgi:hypothetical protein
VAASVLPAPSVEPARAVSPGTWTKDCTLTAVADGMTLLVMTSLLVAVADALSGRWAGFASIVRMLGQTLDITGIARLY